jgi:hypothetical protein
VVDIFSYFRRRGAPTRQPALAEVETIDLASMGGEISGIYLDIASGPTPERKTRSKQPPPPPRARRPPDSVPKRPPPPESAPKRLPPENFAPAPPSRARRQDGNGSAPLERKGVLAVHGVEKTFVGRKEVKGVSLSHVGHERIFGLRGVLPADTLVPYRIRDILHLDALYPDLYLDYISTIWPSAHSDVYTSLAESWTIFDHPLMDLAAVRYVVVPRSDGTKISIRPEKYTAAYEDNDVVLVSPRPNAEAVLCQLSSWIAHYNEVHPHKALEYRSPGEFIATYGL